MRHRPTLILTSLLLLASACSRDFDADDMPVSAPEPEQEQGYVVPVEQALQSLDNELAMICGGDETRAAQPRRRVKAVRNVAYADVAPATRSDEMPDDVADLFYIVEFADGEGSAVLGADKRVEPVVAILDQTVLTPEDFAAADIQSDDITSYMTALMINSSITFPGGDDTAGYDKPLPIDKFWGPGHDTIVNYKQTPLLRTKWNQSVSPYNDLCYNNGEQCPAGCGPIAVAQLLMSNQYPSNITINGQPFNWNLLRQCYYGCIPSYSARLEAARFVYHVGQYMHVTYNTQGSSIFDSNVPPLFNHVGYQSVSLQSFSLIKARNMICNLQHVFYISGIQEGASSGHAWVIDGWNEYTVRTLYCYYYTHDGKTEILDRKVLSSETYTKMHCNFGWGGKCDGYYTYNLFDTTKRLNSEDIDTSVGDYAGRNSSTYNDYFRMITYSLP